MKVYTTATGKLAVSSPYTPDFVAASRKLNGKWYGPNRVWLFDPRDEERVRAAMVSIYGTDGSFVPETTTVTVIIDHSTDNPFFAYGREIAHRFGRDSYVKLGDGVVIIDGDFPKSCGSRRNPGLVSNGTVTLEVRDVPVSLVKDGA